MGCNSIKLNNSWWMITPWRHSCGSWSLVGGEWLGGCVCVCITCGLGGLIPLAFTERWLSRGVIFFLLSMVGQTSYGFYIVDLSRRDNLGRWMWTALCEFWDRARQNSNDIRIGSSRRALRHSDKPSGYVSWIKKESLKNSFFFFLGYNIKGMDKIARLISMELVRCSKTLSGMMGGTHVERKPIYLPIVWWSSSSSFPALVWRNGSRSSRYRLSTHSSSFFVLSLSKAIHTKGKKKTRKK